MVAKQYTESHQVGLKEINTYHVYFDYVRVEY